MRASTNDGRRRNSGSASVFEFIRISSLPAAALGDLPGRARRSPMWLAHREGMTPLQERHDNLLTHQTNNPDFIPALIEAFDPLEFKFTILEEE